MVNLSASLGPATNSLFTPGCSWQGRVSLAHKHFSGLERPDESIAELETLVKLFGESPVGDVRKVVEEGLLLKAAVFSSLNRGREQRATYDEVLRRLDDSDRLAEASDGPAWNKADTLGLRAQVHMLRSLASISLDDQPSAVNDVRTVLEIIPELADFPEGLIGNLAGTSLVFGPDQVATLIRESPSSGRLLPLTTALELEMGLEPRVAIEVQKVAEDIQRDLANLKQLQSAVQSKTSR